MYLLTEDTECRYSFNSTLKADSHMACRAHAMPLIHTSCCTPAMLRQCRVLRESPRGSQKYLNC